MVNPSNNTQEPSVSNTMPPPENAQDKVILDFPKQESPRSAVIDQSRLIPTPESAPNTEEAQRPDPQPLDKSSPREPFLAMQDIPPTSFTAPADPTIPAEVSTIASTAPSHEPAIEPSASPLPPSCYDQVDYPQESQTPSPHPEIPPASVSKSSPPLTPKRTKQDLPIFTATSPIIFGKPKAPNPSIAQTVTPDVAAKAAQEPTPSAQSTGMDVPAPNGTAPTVDHSAAEKLLEKKEREVASIWEVPDTPQVRKR